MTEPTSAPPAPVVRPVGYGGQVLLRYRYPDGRLQAALPMRAIRCERRTRLHF